MAKHPKRRISLPTDPTFEEDERRRFLPPRLANIDPSTFTGGIPRNVQFEPGGNTDPRVPSTLGGLAGFGVRETGKMILGGLGSAFSGAQKFKEDFGQSLLGIEPSPSASAAPPLRPNLPPARKKNTPSNGEVAPAGNAPSQDGPDATPVGGAIPAVQPAPPFNFADSFTGGGNTASAVPVTGQTATSAAFSALTGRKLQDLPANLQRQQDELFRGQLDDIAAGRSAVDRSTGLVGSVQPQRRASSTDEFSDAGMLEAFRRAEALGDRTAMARIGTLISQKTSADRADGVNPNLVAERFRGLVPRENRESTFFSNTRIPDPRGSLNTRIASAKEARERIAASNETAKAEIEARAFTDEQKKDLPFPGFDLRSVAPSIGDAAAVSVIGDSEVQKEIIDLSKVWSNANLSQLDWETTVGIVANQNHPDVVKANRGDSRALRRVLQRLAAAAKDLIKQKKEFDAF